MVIKENAIPQVVRVVQPLSGIIWAVLMTGDQQILPLPLRKSFVLPKDLLPIVILTLSSAFK